MTLKDSRLPALSFALEIMRACHLNQNYIKWNGLFRNMNQLWRWSTLTSPVISVSRTEMPFPLDKIVVRSTALLYPAFMNNNQTRGGLSRVCATGMYRSIGHVEFPKFQTERLGYERSLFECWVRPGLQSSFFSIETPSITGQKFSKCLKNGSDCFWKGNLQWRHSRQFSQAEWWLEVKSPQSHLARNQRHVARHF